jgi:RNA polymerase sigma factor for flagellar operon FliA
VTKRSRKAAKPGCSQTAKRDKLVLEHLPLAKAIALNLYEKLPAHVDLEDLVHAGIIGLIDAASKYNASKRVDFRYYARHRIRGAMLDSLRQLDWASRDMRRRQKQASEAAHTLTMALQREPTELEMASQMGISVETWRELATSLHASAPVSASSAAADDRGPVRETPDFLESLPDQLCAREQLRTFLGEAMKNLPPRYQTVITLYYVNELTMREIGEVLGVNESRVSQIHKLALSKMGTALKDLGISTGNAFEFWQAPLCSSGHWSPEPIRAAA